MHATDCVGEEACDAEDCHLLAILVERNAVGENHLGESTVIDTLRSGVAHDSVRSECANRAGTILHHEVGSLADGSCSINHVVNEDYILILDVANDGHVLNYVGLGTLLVAEHEGSIEILGIRVGTLCATHVGL